MKKFFSILTVCAVFALGACNHGTDTKTTTVDSTSTSKTTTTIKVDSTKKAMPSDTTKKDTTKKM